jgi:biopolymer transport protein TolQ
MEFSFFKGAIFQLVKQMDWIATFILIGLFFLSVICVAIIAFKYVSFRKQRNQLDSLIKRIRHVKGFNELITLGREFQNYAGGKVIMRGLGELRYIIDRQTVAQEGSEIHEGLKRTALTTKDSEDFEIAMGNVVDGVVLEEEMYIPILGTSAAASPLIGLFGTIWGLIHAFVDISQEKSADIATVAPGMAEALIVTLAGLIVAIPALVAFHYFSNELRKLEFGLGEIGERMLTLAKYTFVK